MLLKINEFAFILLPVINLLCKSKNQVRFNDFKLKRDIVLLIFIVFFTEFIVKYLVYNQSIGGSLKAIRFCLPLFSSLVLLAQGIRADIKVIWRVLLYAIIFSVILSIISIFKKLPIYYDVEAGKNILQVFKGRLMNSNSAFGVIGLYLLFKDKDKRYNQGLLVKVASILSVVSLILTFNRTYLAILVLEFLYLSLSTFSLKNIFKLIFVPIFLFGIGIWSYNNIEQVQRQIDKRILSIIFGQISLYDSTIESNRDVIYEGIYDRINEGYWIIGLPYAEPIFIRSANYISDSKEMRMTDTSLVNILLRYGLLPLILFLIILFNLFWKKRQHIVRTVFILYLIASLNIGSLDKHNPIFFMSILLIILYHQLNDKNLLCGQNKPQYRRF